MARCLAGTVFAVKRLVAREIPEAPSPVASGSTSRPRGTGVVVGATVMVLTQITMVMGIPPAPFVPAGLVGSPAIVVLPVHAVAVGMFVSAVD